MAWLTRLRAVRAAYCWTLFVAVIFFGGGCVQSLLADDLADALSNHVAAGELGAATQKARGIPDPQVRERWLARIE
ncbi:MAG: hypothetical protein R6U98_27095, partial [Pirellulaceae bacterium]